MFHVYIYPYNNAICLKSRVATTRREKGGAAYFFSTFRGGAADFFSLFSKKWPVPPLLFNEWSLGRNNGYFCVTDINDIL